MARKRQKTRGKMIKGVSAAPKRNKTRTPRTRRAINQMLADQIREIITGEERR